MDKKSKENCLKLVIIKIHRNFSNPPLIIMTRPEKGSKSKYQKSKVQVKQFFVFVK